MTPTPSPKETMKTPWILHCHHDLLLEPLTEPLENRIAYIKKEKPEDERILRLRLLKVLSPKELNLLPKKAYIKAWKAYDKAWEACGKAWEAYIKARKAYDKAWKAFRQTLRTPAVKKWHKEVCVKDCPWDFEQQTIFPKSEVKKR